MNQNRIKTTVVGSYPVPDWLSAFPSEQALLDATAVVLKTQELAGIDVVADGELYRFDINHPETNGMIDYFIGPLGNLHSEVSRQDVEDFRNQPGMGFRAKPAGVVEGALDEGQLNLVNDYERIRSLTSSSLKFTVTGPHMLTKTLLDRHYGDRAELAHAIAEILAAQVKEIDADIVQLDEANITGSPEEADWAASSLNVVLDSVQNTPAVHMCFGNYGGQSIQKGTWAALVDYMNALHVDHMVLEFAFRGYGELHYLKEVKPEIGIGLGVIDIKSTVVEDPETVARRIEDAAEILGEDRVRFIHPDCGFWMLKRSVADRKMKALVEGRDLFYGRG
jgi:5-methyltetrahydropteroyltriglutamate--homocysteine methyltransferase